MAKKWEELLFFLNPKKKPGNGALWGVVRGRFGLSKYVMTAVLAVPSTGLGQAVENTWPVGWSAAGGLKV